MLIKNKKFLQGILMMVGMIIGVGIFGVPYIISKSGIASTIFYFLILGAAIILTHLFYGEVALRTKGEHRIVGYSEKYLGKWGKLIASFVEIVGFYGAIIAYIIVGGEFLFSLLSNLVGGDTLFYQVFVFVFVSIFVLFGVRLVAWAEFFLTTLLLVVVSAILFVGTPNVRLENFSIFTDLGYLFLPYGVILFSLSGSAVIPEIKEFFKKDLKMMKQVILWGTVVAILITVFFGFVVAGITGSDTSDEAIAGLRDVLGMPIVILGLAFGLLGISTSLLIIGINLKELFLFDYKVKNNLIAWFLSIGIPFLIFLIGSRGFIKVISLTGSVFGGSVGLLIVLMFLRARKRGDRRPEYEIKLPNFIPYIIVGIFGLGIFYEIIYLFLNGF